MPCINNIDMGNVLCKVNFNLTEFYFLVIWDISVGKQGLIRQKYYNNHNMLNTVMRYN